LNPNEPGHIATEAGRPGSFPGDSGDVNSTGACPPEACLRAAAFGEADAITLDYLSEHLNRCDACVRRIETLLREERPPASSTRDADHRPESSTSNTLRNDASMTNRTPEFAWEDGTSSVGRYRLGPCIGQGGIGKVYEATDMALGRVVAIKRLRLELLTPKSLDRFEREARAQAALNHPNIVALHEFGHHHGFPFLVMERIDGEPLSRLIRDHPLAPRAAAALLIPVARAVAHAHHKGLVHRDLKPSNILLANAGEMTHHDDHAVRVETERPVVPKIADFGLARVFNDDNDATLTEEFAGTVAFMAPELVSSDPEPASPASDIYSLGVILYVCLTGRQPFQGQDATSTLAMIRELDPVMPSLLIPGLPRDLETICMKCLEKEPARRYARADDLADDLQRFLDLRPILARPAGLFTRGSRWCRRHPGTAAALAVTAASIVIMTIGGWVAAVRQAELKAEALRNQIEAQRQAHDAEQARLSAEKKRDLAQKQFQNGTTAIHRFGLILESYAQKAPRNEAFEALRKQFRKELVALTDQFLSATDDTGESPALMAQVLITATVAHAMDGNIDRAESLFAQLEDAVRKAEADADAPATIRFLVMNATMAIANAFDEAGKRDDTIRVLNRCWNEWPVDPADPKVPPILISARRDLAFHLSLRLREDGQISRAEEFDRHVAELDSLLNKSAKTGPK